MPPQAPAKLKRFLPRSPQGIGAKMLTASGTVFLGTLVIVGAGIASILQIKSSTDVIQDVFVPIEASVTRADFMLRHGNTILDKVISDVTDPEEFGRVREYESQFKRTMLSFDMYIKALMWGSGSSVFANSSGGLTRAEWEISGLGGNQIVRQAPDEMRVLAGQTDLYYSGFANNGLRALKNHKKALHVEFLGRVDEAREARREPIEFKLSAQEYESLTRNRLGAINSEVDVLIAGLLSDIGDRQWMIISTWAAMTFGFFLFLILFSKIFSKKIIVEPLMKLSRAAQAIGNEQYETRIKKTRAVNFKPKPNQSI